jgi:hypothetical protein
LGALGSLPLGHQLQDCEWGQLDIESAGSRALQQFMSLASELLLDQRYSS